MKEQIITKKCGPCHGPYALGVKANGVIYTTQIGTDVTGEFAVGGMKEQTKALMENAKAVIEAGGSSMDHVVKVTIYISDISLIPEMNEVYETYFTDDYPARCCTQCVAMVEGCLVEMEFTAII